MRVNILVCDSNALSAMELNEILIDHGHNACGAATRLADCLRRCSEQRPDLVLVGLNPMEGKAGLSLVEALTAQGIPSIIVSGEADLIPAACSAKAILFKPIHEDHLARAVGRLV